MQVSPYMCTMKMREVGSNGKWALTPLKTLGAFARILGYFVRPRYIVGITTKGAFS